MENLTPNTNTGALPPTSEAAENQPKRTKTMSEAALAANRANSQKSTGPRTAEGKTRSASNAFQHGLYSMRSFHHFRGHPDLAASIIHNLLEEYQPITPTEHILVQQLIHLQLRFIQMEHFFNGFADEGKLNNPDRAKNTQNAQTNPCGPRARNSASPSRSTSSTNAAAAPAWIRIQTNP